LISINAGAILAARHQVHQASRQQFDPPKGLRPTSRVPPNPTRVTGCRATIAEETDKWGEVIRTGEYQAGVRGQRADIFKAVMRSLESGQKLNSG
jgi:hypothetical protein